MATATTSFPGAYLRVPPKNGVRNALFSQSIVSIARNSRKPKSLKSLKLSTNSFNFGLHKSCGKGSKSGSFVVRCDAAGGRVRFIKSYLFLSTCYMPIYHFFFYLEFFSSMNWNCELWVILYAVLRN